jgi:cyclopropane fatty-acyl-phospholipid synthase-like methyltransferase
LWAIDPGPFLGREVGTMAPGRALDLGAGEGRNAIWLAQRGWRVTAVDFSDVALARAQALAQEAGVGESIVCRSEDLTEFRPEPGTFDLILSLFLHLPAAERRTVLERARAALAPGGIILVVGYDHTNATEGDSGVRDPALLFGPEDITSELDGLEIERAERLRLPGAVDAIVRARRPIG